MSIGTIIMTSAAAFCMAVSLFLMWQVYYGRGKGDTAVSSGVVFAIGVCLAVGAAMFALPG